MKKSIYFDLYYFMIKKQLLQQVDLTEVTENDLPADLRNIQRSLDYRSQDHIVMYVDMINRMPKTQYTRQRLNIAENILTQASQKRKQYKIGDFDQGLDLDDPTDMKKESNQKAQVEQLINLYQGVIEILKSLITSHQFD